MSPCGRHISTLWKRGVLEFTVEVRAQYMSQRDNTQAAVAMPDLGSGYFSSNIKFG